MQNPGNKDLLKLKTPAESPRENSRQEQKDKRRLRPHPLEQIKTEKRQPTCGHHRHDLRNRRINPQTLNLVQRTLKIMALEDQQRGNLIQ